MQRFDRRGRRIGRNAWREYVTEVWRCAHDAWLVMADDVAIGYATELAELRETHPAPTLKQTMIDLRGSFA